MIAWIPPLARGRRFRGACRGVTLIELVLSLAISSLLLLGMASAMLLAVRSMPDPASASSTDRRAERALQQLAAEIAVALAVPEQTASALTLVLPDRNADGLPERVRWWREPQEQGGPLRRRFNDDPAEAVSGPLQVFEALFAARPIERVHTGAPVRGNLEELGGFIDDTPSAVDSIDGDCWPAISLLPELPGGAIAWELGDLSLRIKGEGVGREDVLVEVFRWRGKGPSGDALAGARFLQAQLPASESWRTIAFSAPAGALRVPRGSLLAAVLRPAAGGIARVAQVGRGEVKQHTPDVLYRSRDQGVLWEERSMDRALHTFRGRVWKPGGAWSSQEPRLGAVTLRAVGVTGREAKAVALAQNAAPRGGWRHRADFAVDPALVDLDADGVGDFSPPVPEGQVGNGRWTVSGTRGLGLVGPAAGLPGAGHLRLRLRAVSPPSGASLEGRARVNFGRVGGTASGVELVLTREAGTQTLCFRSPGSGVGSGPWFETVVQGDAWSEVALALDAANGRVAVSVNGEALGTMPAPAGPDSSNAADLVFSATASGFQIDEIEAIGGGAS